MENPRPTLRTVLCDMLGIEYPILLAGMGPPVGRDTMGVAGPELVAAVSNAGGLGVLGGAGFTPDFLEKHIKRIKELTDRPFGVDILLPNRSTGLLDQLPHDPRSLVPVESRDAVDALRRRFELPEVRADLADRHAVLRADFLAQDQVDVIVGMEVSVLAVGLGDPAPYVKQVHAAGAKVIGLVGNVKTARRVAAGGADLIVAQGHEAGGHTGYIGTMALVPQVVDAVGPVPVVAAGGIGDGRGIAASLAMGAVGVWCGTAFIATDEAHLDLARKMRIVEAAAEDTRVTRLFTGKTMRNITNPLIEAWENSGIKPMGFGAHDWLVADLVEAAEASGRTELLMNAAGQISGMTTRVRPAKEVFNDMVAQAVEVLTTTLPRAVVAR
jgi:NAD(P)H-dependent flavin oxidoreductase YrpB (nitropropane dioxygenase family)